MATVEHSALTGSNLHEPKGASSAAVSTVYVSDGIGSGSWTTLGQASLASAAKAFETQLLHVQDQKASGTNSGSFTSSAWRTRTLNTTLTNEITSASIASNQITLPAGTYWIEAGAMGFIVGTHKIRLRNITDGTTALHALSQKCDQSYQASTESHLSGRFTIASNKVFEIQHWCNFSNGTNGFGVQVTTGEVEVYADVRIWKIA